MLVFLLAACASRPALAPAPGPTYGPPPPPSFATTDAPNTSPSGLAWSVLREGEGATPAHGDIAVVHYEGWLADGTRFDSSYVRGTPIRVGVGVGQVIKGWDEALATMKVGEKRRIVIPPHLGYGERAVGPIPAGATLTFEMELLGIEPGR